MAVACSSVAPFCARREIIIKHVVGDFASTVDDGSFEMLYPKYLSISYLYRFTKRRFLKRQLEQMTNCQTKKDDQQCQPLAFVLEELATFGSRNYAMLPLQ